MQTLAPGRRAAWRICRSGFYRTLSLNQYRGIEYTFQVLLKPCHGIIAGLLQHTGYLDRQI